MTAAEDEREPDNGYVVFALRQEFLRDLTDDDEDILTVRGRNAEFEELGRLLAELEVTETTRLLSRARRGDGRRFSDRPRVQQEAPSLLLFWRIDARKAKIEPRALARVLRRVKAVHTAYAETPIAAFTTTAAAGPAPGATFRAGPPDGVNLQAVALLPGGDGSGVRFADIEEAWRFSHPALAAVTPGLLPDADRGNRDGMPDGVIGDHGNAVLGVVSGLDTGNGLGGMAPALASVAAVSHYNIHTGDDIHVADAIVQAVAELTADPGAGKVLLLEVQRGAPNHELPAEVDLATFTAIKDAVAAGVTVVVAGGNGGRDIDAWSSVDPPHRIDASTEMSDSGAIVVGAGRSLGAGNGLKRWSKSNYGARVTCHAWGAHVSAPQAVGFTADFGGTSAASAIVAGVAALTHALYLASHPGADPLPPLEMRRLLATYGTPLPPDGTGKHIGVLPDLVQLAAAVTALP